MPRTNVRAVLEAHGIVCPDDPPSMPCPECRARNKCKLACNDRDCACRTLCDDCAFRLTLVGGCGKTWEECR